MGFMQRDIVFDQFYECETTCGTYYLPQMCRDILEECVEGRLVGRPKLTKKGYFARMSAPGYLDSTDWQGPFDSISEADHSLDIFDEED